jgi:hypothetical protein
MAKIPSVQHLWVGKPAPTDRPVIDSSYSYGLVVALKDMEATPTRSTPSMTSSAKPAVPSGPRSRFTIRFNLRVTCRKANSLATSLTSL